MSKVLIVDDKPMMRDSIAATLRREGFTPVAADGGEAALRLIPVHRPAAIVTDLKMPGLDGIGLLQRVREIDPQLPVILMTAYASVDTAIRALKLGAFDYLRKPFEPQELIAIVRRAVGEVSSFEFRVWSLRATTRNPMHRLRRQIATLAAGQGTVLITGESGTGKELAAHALHAMSERSGRAMLCLNCAVLSESLLESELFGHEKGAFTGADRTRPGRFELADGGTLLLDEISEISLRVQAKLLRVLQERAFERVGSAHTQRVDVRVIATTNRDLEAMVRRGEFRHDLYFRLNVLPLRMPPLRNRLEDVPPLAAHFLARHAASHRFDDAAVARMQRYDWPGNVRELENLCERAAVLADGPRISAELIEPWLTGPLHEPAVVPATLDDLERQAIVQALSRYDGHRQRTAEALGIGVRTLGLKLKKWKEQNLVAATL
jgi:two-component system, NtrC family, response regulator HydG